jgi:hypothetical protein
VVNERTLVTFVLDETGSMNQIKDDTIGGFNAYLKTLKESDGDLSFTLVKFDSNKIDKVHVDLPVKQVPDLTPATYRPGAATPLIDAAVKSIVATAEKQQPGDKVIVVIQTDGYENASREYKQEDLVDLIKEKTAQGWAFVFLGANIDAFDQAADFGIGAGQTMSYAGTKSKEAFGAAAQTTLAYAEDSILMPFSVEQRAAASGAQTVGPASAPPAKVPLPTGTIHAATKRVSRDRSRPRRKVVEDFEL